MSKLLLIIFSFVAFIVIKGDLANLSVSLLILDLFVALLLSCYLVVALTAIPNIALFFKAKWEETDYL